MEKVQPVITRTETPAPRREPVAVIGFVCGLAAFLGSIATIVRDLVWLQGCDANPPYFPAYPALAFGVLGVGLGIVGTKRARSRSLVQRKVGTTGAALAAAGIVTVGVVLGAVVGLVAGGIAGAEGWVSGRFVLVIGSFVGTGIGIVEAVRTWQRILARTPENGADVASVRGHGTGEGLGKAGAWLGVAAIVLALAGLISFRPLCI